MRIYISGPITGVKDNNAKAFEKAENKFKKRGYEVINPLKIPHKNIDNWTDCMKEDIPELLKCDEIFLLANWVNSKGSCLEFLIASALGFNVRGMGK